MNRCYFIPPYLAHRIAQGQLSIDESLRSRRMSPPPQVQGEPTTALPESGEDAWTIHTANNGSTLPGAPVRSAGEPVSGDESVDEAYDGTQASVDLFRSVFARDSFDGRGAPVVVSVHYEKNYDNAFWDGRQLVFGDGDGTIFERFTKPIDVLAHEFTHAVTQYTSGFTYQGQSGALNESISDVFAAMVKQRVLGQSADEADWLIGEGIFRPAVNGRALRSMSEPGTAYDDPKLGKDPQVGSMSEYVETAEDNGGVHINSGIPNRVFYLTATALGGRSWERAGRVWYAALTSASVAASTDFAGFAQATIHAAGSAEAEEAVAAAWEQVGVAPGVPGGTAPQQSGSSGEIVAVRRSGGFAGRSVAGEVDLAADPRAEDVSRLLQRIDFRAVTVSRPQPDRFAYVFAIHGEEVTVYEQDLTSELSELADLVLRDDPDR